MFSINYNFKRFKYTFFLKFLKYIFNNFNYKYFKAINVKNVDYFSLDIEGGEIEVIKGLDFKKINITVLQIENQLFLPVF
jgi:hypothetical protein